MKSGEQWYNLGAYRSEDEAEANAALARKRTPEAEWRVERIAQ
jgi:hypothetical protein